MGSVVRTRIILAEPTTPAFCSICTQSIYRICTDPRTLKRPRTISAISNIICCITISIRIGRCVLTRISTNCYIHSSSVWACRRSSNWRPIIRVKVSADTTCSEWLRPRPVSPISTISAICCICFTCIIHLRCRSPTTFLS